MAPRLALTRRLVTFSLSRTALRGKSNSGKAQGHEYTHVGNFVNLALSWHSCKIEGKTTEPHYSSASY
eukprot:2591691-Pyramimonas_sp.AAC.1